MSTCICNKQHDNVGPPFDTIETGVIDITNKLVIETTTHINSVNGFPTPINGIIYLPANSSWIINSNIDLLGNRIECLGNVAIYGISSETSSLYSDLGDGVALLTTSYTLPIHNLTLGCSTNARIFNLSSDSSNGLDFNYMNIGSNTLTAGEIGIIENYGNAIFTTCAFLRHTDGLTFTGTIGTIGIFNSIFTAVSDLQSGNAHIYLHSALTITRRFRIIYSSLVLNTGRIGIDYQSPTIPNESFILGTVNFSFAGTYVNGIDHLSNITLWKDNIGIINTFISGEVFLQENTTTTTIASSGVFYLISGTTTTNSNTLSRFTHNGSCRLTYTGTRSVSVYFGLQASLEGSTNRDCHIALGKNGTVITTSEMATRLQGTGNPIFVATSQIIILTTNDYVEAFIRNDTDTTSILVEDLVISCFSR